MPEKTPEQMRQGFLETAYVTSHSEFTVKTYNTSINKLRSFLDERYQYNEIQFVKEITNENLNVYEILREYVVYIDKKGYKPRSIRAYLSGAKGYLRYIGVRINSDDFRQIVKIPKAMTNHEKALTKEILIRLLRVCHQKLQTSILVIVSSGLRIGELVQLRLDDIDFTSSPTKIRIRAETTKTRQGRETFITVEATKALKDYLVSYFDWNEKGDNSHMNQKPIFGRTSKGETYDNQKNSGNRWASELSLQQSLRTHVDKIPELNVKNENDRSLIHWHSFRKYFRTTVGNEVNRDFAEALMGHDFYMSTYYTLSEEKRRELYLKAEPELTISDYQEVAKTFAILSEKHDYLSNKVDGMLDYFKTQGVKVPESLLP